MQLSDKDHAATWQLEELVERGAISGWSFYPRGPLRGQPDRKFSVVGLPGCRQFLTAEEVGEFLANVRELQTEEDSS